MGNSKLHNQGTGFRTRKYENTHDFYKTPQWAVDAILEREELEGEVVELRREDKTIRHFTIP